LQFLLGKLANMRCGTFVRTPFLAAAGLEGKRLWIANEDDDDFGMLRLVAYADAGADVFMRRA
jgi:hypothetical protein